MHPEKLKYCSGWTDIILPCFQEIKPKYLASWLALQVGQENRPPRVGTPLGLDSSQASGLFSPSGVCLHPVSSSLLFILLNSASNPQRLGAASHVKTAGLSLGPGWKQVGAEVFQGRERRSPCMASLPFLVFTPFPPFHKPRKKAPRGKGRIPLYRILSAHLLALSAKLCSSHCLGLPFRAWAGAKVPTAAGGTRPRPKCQ